MDWVQKGSLRDLISCIESFSNYESNLEASSLSLRDLRDGVTGENCPEFLQSLLQWLQSKSQLIYSLANSKPSQRLKERYFTDKSNREELNQKINELNTVKYSLFFTRYFFFTRYLFYLL